MPNKNKNFKNTTNELFDSLKYLFALNLKTFLHSKMKSLSIDCNHFLYVSRFKILVSQHDSKKKTGCELTYSIDGLPGEVQSKITDYRDCLA
jgi:hypothetical protein